MIGLFLGEKDLPIQILKKIEKSDKAYGAFLGHFNFSHFPIFHDENCKFKRYKAFPATEESMIKQTECIINLMREVIFVLKTEKVYEKFGVKLVWEIKIIGRKGIC